MNAIEHHYLVVQGQVIREWRKQLHLTQEQLADEAQISRTEEQYIEQAKRNPKVGTLKRICMAMNHSYAELVNRVEHLERNESMPMPRRDRKNLNGQRL
jgi:transcriptional regulator with XRE-family HTH domain